MSGVIQRCGTGAHPIGHSDMNIVSGNIPRAVPFFYM